MRVLRRVAEATTTAAAPEIATKREVRSRVVLFRAAIAIGRAGWVAAVAVYWRSRKISALTAKDTIVLADFKNSTGEKVFDDILKPALEFQLEQSPFLKLLSDQKVNDTLRMMGHPANRTADAGNSARDMPAHQQQGGVGGHDCCLGRALPD